MFSNLVFKNAIAWVLFLISIVGIIFFAENIYANQRCKKIKITLENYVEGHFLNKSAIEQLISKNGNSPLQGTKFNLLNFRQLERNVLKNKLVKSCQIRRTLGGELIVNVKQINPIGRIVAAFGNSTAFKGLYFDETGKFLPLSNQYTKRVMLVSGDFFVGKNNLHPNKDKDLIDFFVRVDSDPFWKANITHIIIDKDKNIVFLPLLGDYLFEYGTPIGEQYENKFNKIKLFYSKIDPENIDRYKMISVKYQNQIVCQLKQLPPTA